MVKSDQVRIESKGGVWVGHGQQWTAVTKPIRQAGKFSCGIPGRKSRAVYSSVASGEYKTVQGSKQYGAAVAANPEAQIRNTHETTTSSYVVEVCR